MAEVRPPCKLLVSDVYDKKRQCQSMKCKKGDMNPEVLNVFFFHDFSFHVHLANHAGTGLELTSAYEASIINSILMDNTRLLNF